MIRDEALKYVLQYAARAVVEIEQELNALDRAIGDGDHGCNMSRGFRSVLDQADQVDYGSLSVVMTFVGRTLMSRIGGASGALYGSLFVHMGNALPVEAEVEVSFDSFVLAFESGVDALKELGGSDINQKTMLDVMIPVLNLLKSGQNLSLTTVAEYAELQSRSTIEMRAEKGRASFLGDRSIGHLDPGARSSQVIISSICKALTLI